jgi:hypothetical protein
MKHELGVFIKSTIIDNDLHRKKCNRLLTQMNECSILLSYNLCFKVIEFLKKQRLL